MATYSNSSPDYAYGDEFSTWQSGVANSQIGQGMFTHYGFLRFSGLTDLLAGGSITSATLTLTPVGSQTISTGVIHGQTTVDASLPADWSAANAVGVTTASVAITGGTGPGDPVAKDVSAIVSELIAAFDGAVIQFRLTDPSAGGTCDVTASLEIVYTPGDVSLVQVEIDGQRIAVRNASVTVARVWRQTFVGQRIAVRNAGITGGPHVLTSIDGQRVAIRDATATVRRVQRVTVGGQRFAVRTAALTGLTAIKLTIDGQRVALRGAEVSATFAWRLTIGGQRLAIRTARFYVRPQPKHASWQTLTMGTVTFIAAGGR